MVGVPIPLCTTVTCLLSAVLGNRNMSTQLARSVDRCLIRQSQKIWFDSKSYRAHPAPRLLRRFSALEAELVARRALRGHEFAGTVMVNGYTLAQAICDRRHVRLIVATDTTPRLVTEMVAPRERVGRRFLGRLYDRRFSVLTRRVDQWLPISDACKDSLVMHYGVDPARCHVTRIPQNNIASRARQKVAVAPYKLLFVGNDFARKGGVLLLDIFRNRMLPECSLSIVSNDSSLKDIAVEGVTIFMGVHDPEIVASHYRSADLLVLPTFGDAYPNVLCEALAKGLPFVSSEVGAIPEIAEHSQAGLLVPAPPTVAAVISAIRLALEDEARYLERSRSAIRYANNFLTMDRFDASIRSVLRSHPD